LSDHDLEGPVASEPSDSGQQECAVKALKGELDSLKAAIDTLETAVKRLEVQMVDVS